LKAVRTASSAQESLLRSRLGGAVAMQKARGSTRWSPGGRPHRTQSFATGTGVDVTRVRASRWLPAKESYPMRSSALSTCSVVDKVQPHLVIPLVSSHHHQREKVGTRVPCQQRLGNLLIIEKHPKKISVCAGSLSETNKILPVLLK